VRKGLIKGCGWWLGGQEGVEEAELPSFHLPESTIAVILKAFEM